MSYAHPVLRRPVEGETIVMTNAIFRKGSVLWAVHSAHGWAIMEAVDGKVARSRHVCTVACRDEAIELVEALA